MKDQPEPRYDDLFFEGTAWLDACDDEDVELHPQPQLQRVTEGEPGFPESAAEYAEEMRELRGYTPCGRAPNMTIGPYLRPPQQIIPIPGAR